MNASLTATWHPELDARAEKRPELENLVKSHCWLIVIGVCITTS